ncbi:MAG: UvrD-helicase domain-containing protein, partial [Myxococcales bacterium]|nr:UvrD-helicase domain-containing protein [Myxococcales bacterium]
LLRGAPGVLRAGRVGIEQLLVDEVQDTDPLQCEVVDLIALRAGGGAAAGDDAGDAPGLMVVGDPKQSIYGWRNADLAAYEAFIERVIAAGGARRPLVVNFRSVPPILEEVQRLIEPVMREQRGVQPAFQELLAPPTPAGGRAPFRAGERRPVEHWVAWATPHAEDADGPDEGRQNSSTAIGPRTHAEQARRIEARALANDLLTLHQRHLMPWRHAAVLLRTTTAQDTYLQALREAQIPFVVERDRSYYKRREIVDAAALARAIVDPNDQVALVAFLRSPYVGVPDAALLPLWRAGLPELLARMMPRRAAAADSAAPEIGLVEGELIEKAVATIDTAAAVTPRAPGIERVSEWPLAAKAGVRALARLRASFVSEPVDRFVERIRELLLVEEASATRYLGAHRLANLERFFRRMLDGLAGGDPGGVHGILRELRSGVAEARAEEEAAAYDETLDAVRVLTIHKSKGLTFEHVYVLGMHGEPGRGRQRPETEADVISRDAQGTARWSLRLLGVPDLCYDQLEARRARVSAAEAVRTLYVAATRPRVRLVLSGRRLGDGATPRSVQTAMSHVDLLEHRRGKRPALEPLLLGKASRSAARVGSDGVRWLLPDRLKAPRVAEPQRRSPAVTLEQASAEVAQLSADRAAAAQRMARPMTRPASARSHETLREQVEAAGEGGRSGHSLSAELAPYVGTAVHRVLETFALDGDLAGECARQRALLPGYLLELDAARRAAALERCEAWIAKLERSELLARLVAIGPRIVAREAPLLLAPAHDVDGDEAVGAVVGTVDLLYRDDDGNLVVADYKTDGVEREVDIAERARVYGEQGKVYVDALERGLGIARPRFELWFLHADVVRAVVV